MTYPIPDELKIADEILYKYGQWAQDRHKKQHCASIEHKYTTPDHEPRPAPLIADFRAFDVQQALQKVPLQYRSVLHAHYIPQRLPAVVARRKMRLSIDVWRATHLHGLRIFKNIFVM